MPTPNYIAGTFIASEATAVVPHPNPSDPTDTVVEVPEGSPADVAAAVAAAEEALAAWRRTTGPVRADALYRWGETIAARSEEIARSLCREVGKPIGEARGEVNRCVVILRYYAGEAVREVGEVIPAQVEGSLQFSLREPLGVVGLITPWNFPLAISLWKAAPALAFGNTVVLKPSEQSALAGHHLAETAAEAGLPPGVFNVVQGTGPGAGEALLRAEGIHGISFTGSRAVGAIVRRIAAGRNLPFQTEMGGKNVVIVTESADLDLAARLTASGAMRFAGQKCTATSRAIVLRSIADTFFSKLEDEVRALRVGDVTDPATAIGPLITAEAKGSAERAVGNAPGEVVYTGEVPSEERLSRGFFFAPRVYRDVPLDSVLARDELFAPVLATFMVDDLDEAIRIANDTEYGLSASLFTRDVPQALDYVRRIEVGLVRVNGDTTGVDPHAPFGGMKGSGSGTREQGRAARDFYTRIKTVQVNP